MDAKPSNTTCQRVIFCGFWPRESSQRFLAVLRMGPNRIIWGTYHLSAVFRFPIPGGNPISEQLSAGSVTESVPLIRARGKCRIGEIFSSCVNCRRYFQLMGSLSFMLCGPM